MARSIVSLVLVGIALLVFIGCSGDPASTAAPTEASTTARTPEPASTPAAALSLDEYLVECSIFANQEDLGDDATYGDFSAAIGDLVDTISSLSPPAEVADWHNATLEFARSLKGLIDSQPEDKVVGFELFAVVAELESLEEAMTQAENALPAEIRQRMAEAGCIEDEGTGPESGAGDDHGDDIDDATFVEVGVPIKGTLGEDDQDYFRFTAVGGHFHQLDIEYGTLTNARLEILDSSGQQVAINDSSQPPPPHLMSTSSDPGDYYVRVGGWFSGSQSSGQGSYTLTISPSEILDDHGDSAESATVIPIGSTTQGAIDVSGEVDYFRLTVNESGNYQTHVSIGTLDILSIRSRDFDSELWSLSDVYAGDTDDGPDCGTPHTTCRELEPGDYYFQIGSYGSTGTYTLTITETEQ